MTKKLEVKIQELEAKIDNIFEILKSVKFSSGTYLCSRCKILHDGVLCLKPKSSDVNGTGTSSKKYNT